MAKIEIIKTELVWPEKYIKTARARKRRG